MPDAQTRMLIHQLRETLLPGDGAGVSDGMLLGRFIAEHDHAAFAALVRRHGPMVWGVCRRVLRNQHDAEDAFQATFLVLVRKAASIVPRELLANWLYGVAHTTARKARMGIARRTMRERLAAEMPEPIVTEHDAWRDVEPLLDQELSRLPDKYRVAIVRCDLQGATRRELARQLRLPEGTISGWLTRGRALLAKRLARRGVAVSAGFLAELLMQDAASASVPIALMATTVRTAGALSFGSVAAGVLAPKVVALAEGVIKAMLLSKLKVVVTVLAVCTAIGLGAARMTAVAGDGTARAMGIIQPDAPGKKSQNTPAELEAARAQADQAEAQLQAARAQLALAEANLLSARARVAVLETQNDRSRGA